MKTIFKPKDYNAIKNEINSGEAVTMQKVTVGMVGKIVDNYVDTTVTPNVTHKKAFVPLVAADLITENIWVALFTPLEQDKVETLNDDMTFSYEYFKRKGEHIALFQLPRLQEVEFEFTSNLVSTPYDTVNDGDVLIPTTDGSMKWVVGATATKAGMKVNGKDNLAQGSRYFGTDTIGSFSARLITQ